MKIGKNRTSEEKLFRIALHSIPGVGSGRLRQLIAYFGSAANAWQAPENKLQELGNEAWIHSLIQKRCGLDPYQIENNLSQKAIRTVIPEEENYPALLSELADAPPLLYYKGQLEAGQEGIAVVGSRKATPYGRAAAEALGKELAMKGFIVVSGLARGIDTAAHKGALAGRGKTWAVLGCGLNHLYPPENEKLAEEIIQHGAILSEFSPGVPPEPQFFPMRNRIISGVAHGVVVVEAAVRSGALITVDCALEQGREVFAVPGPIFSEQSKGCHHLLRQGAKLVEGIEDILGELPNLACDSNHKDENPHSSLRTEMETHEAKEKNLEQKELLAYFSDLPLHIDQIALQSSIEPSQVALLILELQLAGEIEQLPGQRYVLAHKC